MHVDLEHNCDRPVFSLTLATYGSKLALALAAIFEHDRSANYLLCIIHFRPGHILVMSSESQNQGFSLEIKEDFKCHILINLVRFADIFDQQFTIREFVLWA